MEEFKRNKTKKVVLFILLLIPVVLAVITISYAFFQSSGEVEEEQVTITSGTLSLTFRDNDETVENIEGTWNFGDTIEKELVIENTGTKDTYAKINWDNLINTYLAESLTYTLEEKKDAEGSTYKRVETEGTNVPRSESASTVMLADHLAIPAGHTYTYRLRITLEDLPNIDQTADLNANFVTKFTIAEGTKKPTVAEKLENLGIKIQEPQEGVPNFANPATTDETANGLFSMEDDYGKSYYFRGAVENNYVKFGINANRQDMWWRIIRFNGDGSIRMQYDGAGTVGSNIYTRGFALAKQVWNTNREDAKYVGWMFGGAQGEASTSKEEAQKNETDSDIKFAVDNWYKTNILDTGYSKYIADSIFCNDRSIPGKNATGWDVDTELGYAKNYTGYGATSRTGKWNRDRSKIQPIFTCPQDNDKFTVEESNGGNGALTYPVGLITVDEVLAAGSGKDETSNFSYYLYKTNEYWPFSPACVYTNNYAYTYTIYSNGGLSLYYTVSDAVAVAPVINIKAEYLNQLLGDGSLQNPFRLPNT